MTTDELVLEIIESKKESDRRSFYLSNRRFNYSKTFDVTDSINRLNEKLHPKKRKKDIVEKNTVQSGFVQLSFDFKE